MCPRMAKKAKTNKLKAMLDPESVAVLFVVVPLPPVVPFPPVAVHPVGQVPVETHSLHPSNPLVKANP